MSDLTKIPSPDQIKRLPKALLHDHLDGGLRAQTMNQPPAPTLEFVFELTAQVAAPDKIPTTAGERRISDETPCLRSALANARESVLYVTHLDTGLSSADDHRARGLARGRSAAEPELRRLVRDRRVGFR